MNSGCPELAIGTALLQTTAAYTYTSNGLVATLTDARGFRTTSVYDGLDRILRREYPDPTYPNQSSATDYEAFDYDTAGRPASERRRSGEYFTFAYDNLHRLILRDAPASQPAVAGSALRRDVYAASHLSGERRS